MQEYSPVYWFSSGADELPPRLDWLSPEEARIQAGLRFEKRRRDWRLGRWTAKHLVGALRARRQLPTVQDRGIEILAASDGVPIIWINGSPASWTLSISHRAGRSLCAVVETEAGLGCDLEKIEARGDAFVADYFTEAERRRIAESGRDSRPWLANLVWSAKESALKALRTGLRADTRSVEVKLGEWLVADRRWSRLQVVTRGEGKVLEGWCRVVEGFVQTIVSDLPSESPPVGLDELSL